MENKEDRFEITELFMVKAGLKDWSRRFLGTIKRDKDSDGNPILCGKVVVNDCVIYAQADNEELLGERLDEMCKLVLDQEFPNDNGLSTKICAYKYFLN